MRYAVKDRPVEQFDVTLELPEWQLEPDEEALFGSPDDYYYIDENGNVIEPAQRDPAQDPLGPDGERAGNAPPAASRDFLEEATGGSLPENQRPSRRPPPSSQPATRPPPEQ
jgi:penicillin-binding protein 1A